MNIWCISKYASSPNYGTGARLFFLTKEFIRLGHSARLFTSDSNHLAEFPDTTTRYNFEEVEGVPICWIKTKKYTKTASLKRVLSWFDFERWLFKLNTTKFEKPDVVIISSLSILSILYGYYLKKKYKSFLIFEIRDIWPLTMTEEGGFSKWHPLVLLLGWIEKFGYKKSDLVVGTMPKLDLHVQNILGYKKLFFCSPLGFNTSDYDITVEDDGNPFNKVFPEDKIVIGYAGSMGITNALEPFIEAIKMLKSQTDLYFILVGSGDLKLNFEEQLSKCENVIFLPRMKQKQVKYFLNKCDILYLSTKDSEVWKYGQSMNKVVEYMLSGKPIIASYTGYPSMIDEADCGKFINTTNPVDIKNAILHISKMESLQREKLGENGKAWIYTNRKYSFLAKKYIEKIEKLMK
ncbi:MAG: glycosyltransferase WbuB [Epsilonproteobacteria bacterium]|nr:MAG: glycosyltransferase WbuB [Campylobacterota bacterium]